VSALLQNCRRAIGPASAAAAWLLCSAPAFAHVSLPSQVGTANQNQVITFAVGHGCEGKDTVRVEVSLPESVTSARAVANAAFDDLQVVANDAGVPTKVIWEKADARAADDTYSQLGLRIKVPDAPFTTLYFPAIQTCRGSDGSEAKTEWVVLPSPGQPESDYPAPSLTILPAHGKGWNKFTTPNQLTDLTVFDDAEIVWVGDAAYSSNPTTTELIASESGVTALSGEIPAGSEIWVKY
jgi:uncharacterized protein YcnI